MVGNVNPCAATLAAESVAQAKVTAPTGRQQSRRNRRSPIAGLAYHGGALPVHEERPADSAKK